VTLHLRDKEVIHALANYFTLLNGKGFDSLTIKPYTVYTTKHSVSLYIRKLSFIVNIVIPFFDKHLILGVDFSKK